MLIILSFFLSINCLSFTLLPYNTCLSVVSNVKHFLLLAGYRKPFFFCLTSGNLSLWARASGFPFFFFLSDLNYCLRLNVEQPWWLVVIFMQPLCQSFTKMWRFWHSFRTVKATNEWHSYSVFFCVLFKSSLPVSWFSVEFLHVSLLIKAFIVMRSIKRKKTVFTGGVILYSIMNVSFLSNYFVFLLSLELLRCVP